MKNLAAFTLVFLTLSIFGCQDTKETSNQTHPAAEFYKTIGHQIPLATGLRWIETYDTKNNSSQGRSSLAPYAVSNSSLFSMLESINDLNGVAFHYGLDQSGTKHVILIPIPESLSVWSVIPGRVFIDANTGEEISQNVATTWAQNYETANPGAIWFHYFGKNIFEEMATIGGFNVLNIVPALNDADLSPQLLLILTNEEVTSGLGRSFAASSAVYDASYPCPSCPVK
jgi:hypothetical protein